MKFFKEKLRQDKNFFEVSTKCFLRLCPGKMFTTQLALNSDELRTAFRDGQPIFGRNEMRNWSFKFRDGQNILFQNSEILCGVAG